MERERGESQERGAGKSSKGRRGQLRHSAALVRRREAGRLPDAREKSYAVLEGIERAHDPDPDVAELVRRAADGDELAFAELYIAFFDRVYRYLCVALKNQDDAQEVAQDVFLRALSMLDRFEPDRGEFRDWLFSMVRNQAIDHLRRSGRGEALEYTGLRPPSASVAGRAASLADRLDPGSGVRYLVEALPEAQRRVIVLRFVFGLNAIEIADAIGSTPDAVRHMQHRALKALAAAVA